MKKRGAIALKKIRIILLLIDLAAIVYCYNVYKHSGHFEGVQSDIMIVIGVVLLICTILFIWTLRKDDD